MREGVALLLLGGSLIRSFPGFLRWILEERGATADRWTRRLYEHRQRRRDPRAREEMLNEKVLRWVNKDAQARAGRRRRTW